jgi:hypothetical protein
MLLVKNDFTKPFVNKRTIQCPNSSESYRPEIESLLFQSTVAGPTAPGPIPDRVAVTLDFAALCVIATRSYLDFTCSRGLSLTVSVVSLHGLTLPRPLTPHCSCARPFKFPSHFRRLRYPAG